MFEIPNPLLDRGHQLFSVFLKSAKRRSVSDNLQSVTKNRCVTHVKIRGYANFVSSLLAYLISTVVS